MSRTYARLPVRVIAQVLNLLLIVAVLSPFVYLLNYFFKPEPEQHLLYALFSMTRSLLVFVGTIVMMAWFNHRYGGSPGNCLLGLKVIDSRSGRYMSLPQAITRVVLAILSTISVIGVLFMLFDAQRRTLHDRLMGTVVIEHDDDYAETIVETSDLEKLPNGLA